jgi:hydrogenase maturation protease
MKWLEHSSNEGMKTLVIGLGNPILGDDGVGWHVANQILNYNLPITVECCSVGGLSLMEQMIGYEQVILIDAITTGRAPTGTVTSFPLESIPDGFDGHLSSPHDTSLQMALRVGDSMGANLPDQVTVIAIEAHNLYEFSEQLTPPVAAAVPEAVRMVMDIVTVAITQTRQLKMERLL